MYTYRQNSKRVSCLVPLRIDRGLQCLYLYIFCNNTVVKNSTMWLPVSASYSSHYQADTWSHIMMLVVYDGVVVKYILICDTKGMNFLKILIHSQNIPVLGFSIFVQFISQKIGIFMLLGHCFQIISQHILPHIDRSHVKSTVYVCLVFHFMKSKLDQTYCKNIPRL